MEYIYKVISQHEFVEISKNQPSFESYLKNGEGLKPFQCSLASFFYDPLICLRSKKRIFRIHRSLGPSPLVDNQREKKIDLLPSPFSFRGFELGGPLPFFFVISNEYQNANLLICHHDLCQDAPPECLVELKPGEIGFIQVQETPKSRSTSISIHQLNRHIEYFEGDKNDGISPGNMAVIQHNKENPKRIKQTLLGKNLLTTEMIRSRAVIVNLEGSDKGVPPVIQLGPNFGDCNEPYVNFINYGAWKNDFIFESSNPNHIIINEVLSRKTEETKNRASGETGGD